MMALIGILGMAAATVGSLAVSVAAGLLLLKGALRVMESAISQPATAVAGGAEVADFAEYARRSTGSLPANVVELEQAA